jgi:hypothetical protein
MVLFRHQALMQALVIKAHGQANRPLAVTLAQLEVMAVPTWALLQALRQQPVATLAWAAVCPLLARMQAWEPTLAWAVRQLVMTQPAVQRHQPILLQALPRAAKTNPSGKLANFRSKRPVPAGLFSLLLFTDIIGTNHECSTNPHRLFKFF